MPMLTRDDARALAGLRRLLIAFAACLPKPPAESESADLSLILKELKTMSDTFDTAMTKLSGDVTAQTTVVASATQAFRGLVAQLVAAEAAAKNAGATDAQVAGVTTLRQQLEANTAALVAAIPANTEASATPEVSTTPAAPVAEASVKPPESSSATVTAPTPVEPVVAPATATAS